jgi:hypothetical protein
MIDGRIDEPVWQAAPWTDDFVDIEGDLKPLPRLRTRAKMLWDDAYFYVAAELEEPHVWGTLTVPESVIFHDNDFEVFIDPDGDNHHYGEFELNALNTGWDLRLIKPYKDGGRADDGWNIAGLKHAVHVLGTLNDPRDADHGWTIEIAIPWTITATLSDTSAPIRTARRNGSVFVDYDVVKSERPAEVNPTAILAKRPADRDQWRVNFSRVEWQHTTSAGGAYSKIPNRPEDNWVWSPQGVVNMHRPETWGYVQFSTARVGSSEAANVRFNQDHAGPAKLLLSRVYYAQIEFRKQHQRFAPSTEELELGHLTHASIEGPITINLDGERFDAVVVVRRPDGPTERWHIRDDCRTWKD